MSFVVDGSEWDFNGWSSDKISKTIDGVLEQLERIVSRGERFWIGETLQQRPMLGEKTLWTLFDSSLSNCLPRELAHELSAYLSSARYYEDEVWPSNFEDCEQIAIASESPAHNLDVLWAHLHALSGTTMGCIGIRREGAYCTETKFGTINLHWIKSNNSQTRFWREAIEKDERIPESLRRLAPHAFPNLYFADSVWRECSQLAGGYTSQFSEIIRYLSILNDYGAWAFTAPPPAQLPTDPQETDGSAPPDQLIIKRFALFNLDITPEKPNVKDDLTCRQAREITLKGKTFYCEWHAKLQAWQNRIHIHPPALESDGKLIIAIMAKHLPLPG